MISPAPLHVLILPDPISHATATPSGIVYQSNYAKRDEMLVHLKWGTVQAVGEDCDPNIKPGHRACYNPFDAFEIEDRVDGTLYEVIPMIGLKAVIDKS